VTISLRDVALRDLERLADLVQSGSLRPPISEVALLASSLEHVAPALEWARTLPAEALLEVVRVVVAERRERREPRVELVWTGPDVAASLSRDTAVVVRELFASAQRSALIAGYTFDHGTDILCPLHEAMRSRGVQTAIYVDLARAPAGRDLDAHLRAEGQRFLGQNWPFGDPLPDLFFDPRTLPSDSVVSLHAKCIVIDDERVLITSANFTDRGQNRNIEVGALVDDAAFAAKLAGQWRALTVAGLMRKWSAEG
jgi:phosphatidylserine/phosphatidylglycerophosphate/cardiolipin synthase-like enzyme